MIFDWCRGEVDCGRSLLLVFMSSGTVGTLREYVYIAVRRVGRSELSYTGLRTVLLGGLGKDLALSLGTAQSIDSAVRKCVAELYLAKTRLSKRGTYIVMTVGKRLLLLVEAYSCDVPIILASSGRVVLDRTCRRIYLVTSERVDLS